MNVFDLCPRPFMSKGIKPPVNESSLPPRMEGFESPTEMEHKSPLPSALEPSSSFENLPRHGSNSQNLL